MSRKRDNSYLSRHGATSAPKRRRPLPPPPSPTAEDDKPFAKRTPPPAVVVMGLSPNCSVLDLKSRFEIYGAISRIRIDRNGVGYITYRTKESAEAAIAAALDSSFGITVDSQKVQVLWASDPLAQWKEAVRVGADKDNGGSSSKLLRAEVPLSRRGRGNKLASAIVNPRNSSDGSSALEVPFKGREIIAYDDILHTSLVINTLLEAQKEMIFIRQMYRIAFRDETLKEEMQNVYSGRAIITEEIDA